MAAKAALSSPGPAEPSRPDKRRSTLRSSLSRSSAGRRHTSSLRDLQGRRVLTDSSLVSHLVLPGDGDAARGHFAVERLVFGLQVDAFDRGELLDVQHVFAVDCLRLERTRFEMLAEASELCELMP